MTKHPELKQQFSNNKPKTYYRWAGSIIWCRKIKLVTALKKKKVRCNL